MKRWLMGWMMVVMVGFMSGAAVAKDIVVRPGAEVRVVYIGAPDCPPCRSWRYTRAGGWWRAEYSGLSKTFGLTEVKKSSLRDAIRQDHFPDDLQFIHAQRPTFGNVVPAWLVLLDGVVVYGAVGEQRWDSRMEPLLTQIGHIKAAGGTVTTPRSSVPNPEFKPLPAGTAVSAAAMPFLDERISKGWSDYLVRENPKAFAIAADGAWAARGGDKARSAALAACARSAFEPCMLFADGDQTSGWRSE
jgi:hypothetical protein